MGERIRCWSWNGAKDSDGYGQVMVEGKVTKSPRVAFFLRFGTWPVNACHKCDNPRCCNPDHIYDGTPKTNAHDRTDRGRNGRCWGEKHGRSVLKEQDVLAIRAAYQDGEGSMSDLALVYGCSFSTIHRVITRKNWKHI